MDVFAVVPHVTSEYVLPFVVLYIGPETILPLTSALAAVVGVLLIVWRQALAIARKLWRLILRKEPDV
jgi:hypothetical protein